MRTGSSLEDMELVMTSESVSQDFWDLTGSVASERLLALCLPRFNMDWVAVVLRRAGCVEGEFSTRPRASTTKWLNVRKI